MKVNMRKEVSNVSDHDEMGTRRYCQRRAALIEMKPSKTWIEHLAVGTWLKTPAEYLLVILRDSDCF
jgi:hypothetical protein